MVAKKYGGQTIGKGVYLAVTSRTYRDDTKVRSFGKLKESRVNVLS